MALSIKLMASEIASLRHTSSNREISQTREEVIEEFANMAGGE
jgi:hypothetical protein